MKEETIIMTADEQVMYRDYLMDSGQIARQAIRAYVENDEPIPNELKPILYEILQQNFKGKRRAKKAAYWKNIVKEVVFLTEGIYLSKEGDIEQNDEFAKTRDKAIEQVANLHGLTVETVERRYRSSCYRPLKDALRRGAK